MGLFPWWLAKLPKGNFALLEPGMKVQSGTPVSAIFHRGGGTVIVARIDYWSATPHGWEFEGQNTFQAVTQRTEPLTAPLPPGTYTAVLTVWVEESVTGFFNFDMWVAGVSVYASSGDVNTTSDPKDKTTFKTQFLLEVH